MLPLYYKNQEDKSLKITGYEAICNLGNNIDEIYKNAIDGVSNCFDKLSGYITDNCIRVGLIKTDLPIIANNDFNIRCNRLILKTLGLMQDSIINLQKMYSKNRIGVVVATTNSGVEEYEKSKKQKHSELGNPAYFLKQHLELNGFYTTVSTACSSGLKAFIIAKDLINNDVADAVIIICVDTLAKIPVFGFSSLNVLSEKPSVPLSKNRSGMNIGEACSIFITEKDDKSGISIMGLGESSDVHHSTTPDPEAKEAIKAIKQALYEAKKNPNEIDYINLHGTGKVANDIMEARAIYKVFSDNVPVSSTKPLTGHCLGAAAGIETALCCKLLDNFEGKLYPHIYNSKYDTSLPMLNIVQVNQKYSKCKICMCNSFGFGGANAIMIIGKENE